MWQKTEYQIFMILATVIWLVFVSFIFIFVFQYRKRKLLYEKEKAIMNAKYTQDLLNTKLEIQEHTMQDIGREIHDNVGQKLTLASIYANQLSHDKNYPNINERISEIGNIISESLSELRALSKSLTIVNTDASELVALIAAELDRVNALHICEVSFTINNSTFELSTTIKNFILRIIQEFMQNSLKHARCRKIDLVFNYSDEGLSVHATDDGTGFDIQQYTGREKKGIGLMNMKKRAELIGADFSIQSSIDKGTSLALFIPANKLYA